MKPNRLYFRAIESDVNCFFVVSQHIDCVASDNLYGFAYGLCWNLSCCPFCDRRKRLRRWCDGRIFQSLTCGCVSCPRSPQPANSSRNVVFIPVSYGILLVLVLVPFYPMAAADVQASFE